MLTMQMLTSMKHHDFLCYVQLKQDRFMFTRIAILFLAAFIVDGHASNVDELPLKKRSLNGKMSTIEKSSAPIKKAKSKKPEPTNQRDILKKASLDLDLRLYGVIIK